MARKQELAARRAQAKRALALSRRKYNRITGELGVENLGKYQPRLPDPATIDRYTMKQLDSFIASSEQFRSRSNDQQFILLGRDTVITKQRWAQFDRQQRIRQRKARDAFEKFENIFIPTIEGTIGEHRREMMTPRRRQMEGNFAHSPDPRSPGQIPSEDALDQLEGILSGHNSGAEQKRLRRIAMQSLDKMAPYFAKTGDKDLIKDIKELSDDQFYALWMIRDSAQNAADWYINAQRLDNKTISSDKAAQTQHRIDQARDDLRGLIEDVKKKIPGADR